MDFKTIKLQGAYKAVEGYEISRDGMTVRETASGKTIPLCTTDRGVLGVVLKNVDGEDKAISIKAIYRWSWYKAFPGDDGVETKPKQTKKIKDPKAEKGPKSKKVRVAKEPEAPKKKRRKGKSVLIPGKEDIMSEYSFNKMNELIQRRRDLGATGVSVELYENNGDTIRVLIDNIDEGKALVRLTSQSWRNGYWFVNLADGASVKFEDDKHRKDGLTGDQNILWPKFN